MTDISAVLRLFPAPALYSGEALTAKASIYRGACPYDAIRAAKPDAFSPTFIGVIEAVRGSPRWGPIYRGDLSQYQGDHSAADLALCGAFARRGLDSRLTDKAFRTSALYREKWERDDYRNRTISLSRVTSQPAPFATRSWLNNGFLDASRADPPARDWVIDGMFLAGKAAIVAGLSGVSKSQLSLQAAMAIATGTPFMGRVTKRGAVVVISGEDDRHEVKRRVNAFIRRNRVSAEHIEQIRSHVRVFPAVGENMHLTERAAGQFNSTGLDRDIVQIVQKTDNVRLIVLDHVGLMHGGDFSAKEDAAVTMRLVNGLAQQTGAAVMLLAHSPKASAKDEVSDASAIFGSTAFVEQARGGWLLAAMRTGEAKAFNINDDERKHYASMVAVKANYSPAGSTIWFRRDSFDEVGVLQHIELQPPTPVRQNADLQAEILAKIRGAPGQYSKSRLRVFAGLSGPWKSSRGSIDRAAETMLTDGLIHNRPPTPAERAKYDHGSQVRQVLDVGPGANKVVKG